MNEHDAWEDFCLRADYHANVAMADWIDTDPPVELLHRAIGEHMAVMAACVQSIQRCKAKLDAQQG